MAAYVMANVEVTDPAGFAPYRAAVPATIAKYDGRYLARGGEAVAVEGDSLPKRVVLLEFPTAAQAKAWWSAPEFAYLKALRQASARTRMIVVEGVEE